MYTLPPPMWRVIRATAMFQLSGPSDRIGNSRSATTVPATTAADPSRKAISSAPVERRPAAAGRCPGAASLSGGGPTARRGPPAAAPATASCERARARDGFWGPSAPSVTPVSRC